MLLDVTCYAIHQTDEHFIYGKTSDTSFGSISCDHSYFPYWSRIKRLQHNSKCSFVLPSLGNTPFLVSSRIDINKLH